MGNGLRDLTVALEATHAPVNTRATIALVASLDKSNPRCVPDALGFCGGAR
jgi:hypothetical protein